MQTEFLHCGPPSRHACNTPGLSPIEFLTAVYNDSSLPMSIRIEAARGVLPFVEPRPASIPSWNGCTIIIPPLMEPRTPDHEALPGSSGNHSENLISPNIPITHSDEAGDPQNLETTSSTLSFEPLSPDEILHLKTIALRHGLPEPHLCSYCGFWQTKTYPECICADREPSKLN
jgi:hypothetical protein